VNAVATLVPVLVALFGALVALSERNTRLIMKRLAAHDGQFAELHREIRDLERHMNVRFDVVNGRIDRLERTA